MPCGRPLAWGYERRLRARSLAALLLALFALVVGACGSNDGKHKAVACRSDDDCDATELGVCDSVSCVANQCEVGSRPDGHRCDDSDPLTGEDACLSGICAGVITECDDELGPCLQAVYDEATDKCVVEPVADGAPCDDTDACTQLDSCEAGECVGAEPKTCQALDDCHEAGECDPESGECSEPSAEDGTPCDDGLVCTSDDVCSSGACGGEAVPCDDGLACSVDACDEKSGGCASDVSDCSCLKDEDCSDGNACNGAERCNPESMLCEVGTPVVCAPSPDPCLRSACLPESGECAAEPAVDGTACDDADACTGLDTCQDGLCSGSEPVVCTALGQCHVPGSCDRVTGACSNPEKPQDSSCNDGSACSTADTCQAGECVGAGSITCKASDQCHDAGVCSPQTGACSNPAKSNGVSCSDGDACSTGDACQAGKCTPAGQKQCAAQDSCHNAGSCDAASGNCSNPGKPDGSGCSDGLACTSSDVCTGGKCAGSKLVCDDKIACTVDSCSEQLGGCAVNSTACACKTSADCNDGNPCNGAETCDSQTLQCKSGNSVDCSAFDSACGVGVCSASTGQCAASPKANGAACDDGDLCSQASSCQAGACTGSSPVTCSASDQCHDAGTCNPGTGLCSDPIRANDSVCNDGNACTQTDSCQAGVCTGKNAIVCSASDQCHAVGTCNKSTGVCSNPAKKNDTACSDGSLCTQTDTCQGGVCVGASPITCGASDQCHSAGKCDAATGICSDPPKKDDTPCADANLCTPADTCQKGVCTGGSAITCTASDQCHTAGTCASATGICSNPAKKDDTPCVDASLCTQVDKCVAGVCTGSSLVTCTASDSCHNVGACDAVTGKCSNPAKPDDSPCDDGKTCTGADKCTGGKCGGGTVACNDNITCTADSCVEPGGCQYDPSNCGCAKDADCDDKNPCSGVETCNLQTLSCVAGTPVNCSGLDNVCNTGTCDVQTGACKATPRPDKTPCDDGSACTQTDGCVSGACVGGSTVTCTASDQCHMAGTCAPATGVCSNPAKPNNTTCNDGNKCTLSDTCQTGACTGSPVACSPLDQCHDAGVCATATGVCSNPKKPDATGCDDGDRCTQTDTCQAGACSGGNPVVCSALDQCHSAGTCAKATGVCDSPKLPDDTVCDDSDKCTQTDTCQAGACSGGNPVVCKSRGTCFDAGTCDKATGICDDPYTPSGTSCSDSNACTTGEKCDGNGTCKGGSKVVCQPPANPCKTNICDTLAGCVQGNSSNTKLCDDSDTCSQLDQCSDGVCTGKDFRNNPDRDWADDPGLVRSLRNDPYSGPTSVDIFSDADGNAVGAGVYYGEVRFDDKDNASYATLPLPAKHSVGIYWARYKELGGVAGVANIGGSNGGALTVEHAAAHVDGSFTLVGTLFGVADFGLDGSATRQLDASKGSVVWVAHYKPDGSIAWLASFNSTSQIAPKPASVAAYDDGSVIAIGTTGAGTMRFRDDKGLLFATEDRAGVWAAQLDPSGSGKWGQVVVIPGGAVTARAVTTHEDSALPDGGASLTGEFSVAAGLGPQSKLVVSVADTKTDAGDIWFLKLDRAGALRWGGRIGGGSLDIAGDVARSKGGGTVLLANLLGPTPNASDSKNTQQLFSANPNLLAAHVIPLDSDGVMLTDGLIADKQGGATRGYQVKLDAGQLYAVGGTFSRNTSFWSKLGFGAGTPPAASFSIASPKGPLSLFFARVDTGSTFAWGHQAGGDGSGMAQETSDPPRSWDIVMTGHSSHSITLAGMFDAGGTFGDALTETLTAGDPATGSPFFVHVNSEAQYDYCK